MQRPRAFAAILKDYHILMVHEVYPDKDFWTLPGGGLEEGETNEEAVVREVHEEVSLDVRVVQFLFSCNYDDGLEYCYLVEIIGDCTPKLGYDPELPLDNQVLKEVNWRALHEVRNDHHVSRVIEALGLTTSLIVTNE